MRLNVFISKSGITSRRKADELIKSGKVKVDGKVAKELGVKVNPESNRVEVDGKEIKITPTILIVLNKPRGYVTSLSDPHSSHTVNELVKGIGRVFPVGRLDKDAEGLLLLTNDGKVAYRLTHPKFGIEKEYIVNIDRKLSKDKLRIIENGIYWRGEMLRAKKVEIVGEKKVKIILTEGKKREIKKIMESIGCKVTRLVRVRVGNIKLQSLKPGRYRKIDPDMII